MDKFGLIFQLAEEKARTIRRGLSGALIFRPCVCLHLYSGSFWRA